MATRKKRKPVNDYAVETGNRLFEVIRIYFKSQKDFSIKSGISPTTISDYKLGYLQLSEETALALEQKLGINRMFLLHDASAPMMIDPNIKPMKDFDVKYDVKPIFTAGGVSDKLKQHREETSTQQGVIVHTIMSREGLNSEISNQGTINIVGITVNGIKNPQTVQITDKIFIKKYKDYYPIAFNCYIIVSSSFTDGDLVLLKSGRDHEIAILDDGKYQDVITENFINATYENVIGKIYTVVNKIMYHKLEL